MNDIKNSLIKIAYQSPNLRKDLVNILEQANNKQEAIKGIIKLAYVNPEIREYALPFIKEAARSSYKEKQKGNIARKEQQKDKSKAKGDEYKNPKPKPVQTPVQAPVQEVPSQQGQTNTPKSEMPPGVAEAAKSKNLSSVPLNEYMRKELGNKKFPNPKFKKNPKAQKEIAISTVLSHASNSKDPLQKDYLQILEPLLEAIVKEAEKEESSGQKKEDTTPQSSDSTPSETPTPTQPATTDPAAETGSPKNISLNAEAQLDETLNSVIDDDVLNLDYPDLEEWQNGIIEKHLTEKVTGVFESLNVPNAKEVGNAVVEARKEETAVEKGLRELNQKMEAHKKNLEYNKQFSDITYHALSENFNDLFYANQELEGLGLPDGQLPNKSIEEINKDFEDFKKSPNKEKLIELLSQMPKTRIESLRKSIQRRIQTEIAHLSMVDKNIELKLDIKETNLDEVKPIENGAFIDDKNSSTNLKRNSENLLNEPSKENLEKNLNTLPECVAEPVIQELKENGFTPETIKTVAIVSDMVSQKLDDHNKEEEAYTYDDIFPKKTLSEKLKSLKDGFIGAFREAKDLVKYGDLVSGGSESQMDAGKYLQDRGLSFNDLKGEKREEALKAMDEFKNIHETKKIFKEELKGLPQDKIEDLSKLRGKLKGNEFTALINKTQGDESLKDILKDDDKFKSFKDKFNNNIDVKEKARELGLKVESGGFDSFLQGMGITKKEDNLDLESDSARVKEIHNLLKDKKISNKQKEELAREYIRGNINKDDMELFDKIRLRKDLSVEEKENLGVGDDVAKLKNLKRHKEKQEMVKEFAKGKKYKDDTTYDSPDISYDEIVELSKSDDEDDKKWATKKLKDIEKDYEKDIESKSIMKEKEREEIEKLFKNENGEDIKMRDDREENKGKKYTLNQLYEMADSPNNPKNQAWASNKLNEIRKNMSGETEATKEEVKADRKKELEKEKSDLPKKLKEETDKIEKEHSDSIKKLDDEHNSQKEKIEKAVDGDIAKLKNEHENKIKQKRDEADTKIKDILKAKGFNSENEEAETKRYVEMIEDMKKGKSPQEIENLEKQKKESLKKVEDKRNALMEDPEIKKINEDFESTQKAETEALNKAVNKKEQAKKLELNVLQTETEASKAKLNESKEEKLKNQKELHDKKTKDIEDELSDKKVQDAFDGASNLSSKQKDDLKSELDSFEDELDDLDEEEAEDRSRELVKKVRSTGKGNKELERLIMENNKALLDMYYGRGGSSGGKEKSPKKTEPKKNKPKKTEPEIEESDSSEDNTSDESMKSFFSGKTFTYTHNVGDGTDKGIDRKKTVDFEELLNKYRKTKSKTNPFNDITSKNIQKVYEDAKKTYEQQTGKKQNKKANDKSSKIEEIKKRIKEKSKFDEKDFEELKPYFGDDLRFDKERYLADKKKLTAEKARELEEKRTKFELEKTKMEVMELKKQMASLSESKKASLKKQIVKIALSSKKEIKDIILNLI
jgi:hypothetical protein